MNKIIFSIIFLVLAIVSLIVGGANLKELQQIHIMNNWPVATATIKQSQAPEVYRTFASMVQGKKTAKLVNVLELEYLYSVNGKGYLNKGMGWNNEFILENDSDLKYAKVYYAVGNKIGVIYNPQNPQESYVLKPSYMDKGLIFLSSLISFICFVFLIYYRVTGKYKDDELEEMLAKAKELENK